MCIRDSARDEPKPRPKRWMAPLMLVSEQRVDKPEASENPVRPRRIRTEDLDVSVEATAQDVTPEPEDLGADDGFRQFVEDTAPEGLQEMLEASAAYGSALAGEKSSSRPQIMSRVIRLMPEGSFSREEGLRAFGVLLREGRIRRVERGRFAIAPNSRFNQPQKKSAAG